MTKTLAQFDAEMTAAGYDMTRSWVALCVDGIAYGIGRTEDAARDDAERWLAEADYDTDTDEADFVPITEYQASRAEAGHVAIDSLVRVY